MTTSGDLTVYEYFDKQIEKEEMLEAQAKIEIKKIEHLTLTERQDLEFVSSLNPQDYKSFLRRRFQKLKDKFYEENGII